MKTKGIRGIKGYMRRNGFKVCKHCKKTYNTIDERNMCGKCRENLNGKAKDE